jgi:hypothetical protein
MNRKLLAIVFSLAFAAMLYAQGDKSVTINGYLIDNACAESAKDIGTRAKNHSTTCALMDSCEKSGYSVVADDSKVYKLDDKGNDSAADLLKNTKTKKGVKVAVEGTVDGTTIKVNKLSEITEVTN